ncbi:hypothetical protein K490DRAFT_59816 [Saccharata proteae CBS 121410]|uniref:Uncharacterized protein n=1 Tax=Saccharata proteae CBS 121410 TaxID=1314787 RepID=A0A9P4HPU0_9PEZI|nr:hypothetical protein K490DRAFT_59816 [Saccharata proteae CBS 121410]
MFYDVQTIAVVPDLKALEEEKQSASPKQTAPSKQPSTPELPAKGPTVLSRLAAWWRKMEPAKPPSTSGNPGIWSVRCPWTSFIQPLWNRNGTHWCANNPAEELLGSHAILNERHRMQSVAIAPTEADTEDVCMD